MNKKRLYKEVAKIHGVTWQEVKRDMESALEHAYTDPNRNILNVVTQSKVEKQGEVPTPEEFVRYAKKRVELEHPELIPKKK